MRNFISNLKLSCAQIKKYYKSFYNLTYRLILTRIFLFIFVSKPFYKNICLNILKFNKKEITYKNECIDSYYVQN